MYCVPFLKGLSGTATSNIWDANAFEGFFGMFSSVSQCFTRYSVTILTGTSGLLVANSNNGQAYREAKRVKTTDGSTEHRAQITDHSVVLSVTYQIDNTYGTPYTKNIIAQRIFPRRAWNLISNSSLYFRKAQAQTHLNKVFIVRQACLQNC